MTTDTQFNPKTELKAFNQFKEEQTTFSDVEMAALEKALNNYRVVEVSEELRCGWLETWGGEKGAPPQLKRDQSIVDFLHRRIGMNLERAADLWSKWEDYEYNLIPYANK
jgi:hypothetical protein